MRITVKKKNVKRLASLSALGAGALVVGVPTAEAGIIYTPVGATIGFSSGSVPSALFTLPGGAQFNFARASSGSTGHVAFHEIAGYVGVRTAGGLNLRAFAFGAPATGAAFFIGVAARHLATINLTSFDSTNKYYMFKFFNPGFGLINGWGELAVTFAGDGAPKPDVTLVGYAFETTGAPILAGDLGGGGPAVPEPSSMALSGLGALILGAAGIRRWRAARQS